MTADKGAVQVAETVQHWQACSSVGDEVSDNHDERSPTGVKIDQDRVGEARQPSAICGVNEVAAAVVGCFSPRQETSQGPLLLSQN